MGYKPDCHDHIDVDATTCDCCTESLARLIRENFRTGDIIGLTFIDQGTAAIVVGIFVKVTRGTLVVNNLFVENTTSYVPLCRVDSVEKGITPGLANQGPVSVALTR